DKNTYLTFRSKIKNGVLKEANITPFFNYKYHIIKFMEENNIIQFKKESDLEEELYAYDQLYKVIDSYNTSNADDDEYDDDMFEIDPMNDIDEKYIELC